MLTEAGCRIILCTPTPYNDVTPTELKKCAANVGLGACADTVRALAESRLAAARETGDTRKITWYETYLATVESREEYESELVLRTLCMVKR